MEKYLCYRVRREGDERRVVASNLQSPVRLAVDWVSHLVFWTDDVLDVIEVADIDGVNRSDHYGPTFKYLINYKIYLINYKISQP